MNLSEERNYCLDCNNKPCIKGCPLENDIPKYIKSDYKEAFEILCETTVMPAVCGRICASSEQCKKGCTRAIKGDAVKISEIETDIGDVSIKNNYKIPTTATNNNKKVAIVGGGPAGLTAAAFLAKEGTNVTIYEKHKELGGLLNHGIPEFRLPKQVVEDTVNKILAIGNIEVEYNKELGENISIEELEQKYDYILLAFGANVSRKMEVTGEETKGVYGANEVLEYDLDLNIKDKVVAIIGGGNVSLDAARTIKKKGAKEVYILYRREEEQMPADKKEIKNAKDEGVEFVFKTNVINIIERNNVNEIDGDTNIEYIECNKNKLEKNEKEERLAPVSIPGSNYTMKVDYLLKAIGSQTANYIHDLNLELDKSDYIKIDENYKTSNNKVYACGDLAGEKHRVVWAVRSGREAAKKILEEIKRY